MNKPIVIIPASQSEIILDQTPEARTPRFHLYRAYAEAIKNAGGIPFLITRPDNSDIDQIISLADGLLLAGGCDIHPMRYGVSPKIILKEMDIERDRIEFILLEKALAAKLPILAVCRGMQLINIQQGGTLYQDIADEVPHSLAHDFNQIDRNYIAHDITIEEHSLLSQLVKSRKLSVNSLHHQGIKRLGDGLTAIAHSSDGLIEAVELTGHPFCIGVQWHPEEIDDAVSQKLFLAFVSAAHN